MKTELSIIIPTHRRLNQLKTLLASLARQDVDTSKIEVIIISNFKDQSLRDFIDSTHYPFKIILDVSGEAGVNIARNRGIDLSGSDLLLFLDDDVELMSSDYLNGLLHLLWPPRVVAYGGDYQLKAHAPAIDEAYHYLAMRWFGQQDLSSSSCLLLGGNTLYHRGLLGQHLRFDESIVFGGAETELNLRLLEQGYCLNYREGMSVYHHTSLSFFSFVKKAYLQGRGKAKFCENVSKDLAMPEKARFITKVLQLIYQDVFYLGKCLASQGGVLAFFIYQLKWRIIPLPLALTFISISLFLPLSLIGVSVIYIDYWERVVKKK